MLVITLAAFSSCSTAYKTGQTPDDVYYSPARPEDEYVRMEREDDRRYRYEEDYYDDRYLRMKVRNRYQWNDLNDWYYYERWGFGHNYYYGSYYNPYNTWNYYYNPYCSHTVFVNTGFPRTYTKPRIVNLQTYTGTAVNNPKTSFSNPKYGIPGQNQTYTGNNNNNAPRNSSTRSGSNTGNLLRTIFSGGNSGSSSSGSSGGTKTSTSGSSSSGSSGSSSGSSAPVRRF